MDGGRIILNTHARTHSVTLPFFLSGENCKLFEAYSAPF